MPAFEYTALTAKGRQVRGVAQGDSPRQVRQTLRARRLTPLAVKPISGRSHAADSGRGYRGERLRWDDLALITQQLASLLRAGLPVEQALHAIAEQAEQPRVRKTLSALRARIAEGQSLSRAMADMPRAFPVIIPVSIRAGEASGQLDQIMTRLARHAQAQLKLRREVLLTLLYPMILTLVAILVITGLLIFVIPSVIQVFVNMDRQLPLLTRILLGLSDGLRHDGLLLAALLAGSTLVWRLLLRHPALRSTWDGVKLALPVLGGLLIHLNATRLVQTLATLINSGVPAVTALTISTPVLAHAPLRSGMEHAIQAVREGGSLSEALRTYGRLPALSMALIAAGEAGGDLGDMLTHAAEQLETELANRVQWLVRLFEPLVILIMGALVLAIVLAMLLPIFEMNQLVR